MVNLRDVAKIENSKNAKRRIDNTTGATGVYRHGQNDRWVARIGRKYISSHATFDDALAARKAAEKAHGYHPNTGRASC